MKKQPFQSSYKIFYSLTFIRLDEEFRLILSQHRVEQSITTGLQLIWKRFLLFPFNLIVERLFQVHHDPKSRWRTLSVLQFVRWTWFWRVEHVWTSDSTIEHKLFFPQDVKVFQWPYLANTWINYVRSIFQAVLESRTRGWRKWLRVPESGECNDLKLEQD